MKESRLTPFDAETILMIKSVTGHEPEITEKAESFEMKMYVDDKDEYIVKAAIDAVIGRYGMRVRAVKHIRDEIFLRGATFFVEYERGAEKIPNEVRTELRVPNENAGYVYCRRLLEVRAVPVSRENTERLIDFTGGGTMMIPRTPNGIAKYSFPTENGVMLDVPEGYFVILMPDGKFARMDKQTFLANFEEKDAKTSGLTFDEKRLFEKMNSLFGKNIQSRFSKLVEECHELFVVADDMLVNGIMPDDMTEIIDELAAMNAVLFHIAALFGYSQKELLEIAYKKNCRQGENPQFMRKHPHKDTESPFCGNCSNFENEDAEGDGLCKVQNRMRHCSCLACNKWQDKQKREYEHFTNRFNKTV